MPSLMIEVLEQLKVKHNGVLESWAPGQRISLPEDQAYRLIEQVGTKVRLIEATVAEVVTEPVPRTARPIYWQSGASILGPATPEYLGRLGERFFVFVQYQGQSLPIDSARLRSQQAFNEQVLVPAVPKGDPTPPITVTPASDQPLPVTRNLFDGNPVKGTP